MGSVDITLCLVICNCVNFYDRTFGYFGWVGRIKGSQRSSREDCHSVGEASA